MRTKLFLIILFFYSILFAESETSFKGQLVGAPNVTYANDLYNINGYIQYLPIAEYSQYLENFNYSFDIAGNFMTNFTDDPATDLYRLKFSLANNQNELRLGLQKINFGPASVLRSLKWFDTMSPTDPLKLTNGVYGALYRHYFLNNNNIWLWSLYGNDDLKGLETVKTKENRLEFGGRSQIMVFNGEMGLTFHYRQIQDDSENKIALDGRWDYFVGSWFEGVIQSSEDYTTKLLTLGIDYTFGIGNGLYCLGEHQISDFEFANIQQDIQYSSIMISYPFTMFDNFNSITYYSWETGEVSQHIGWQRTYDNFIYNVNLFHFPESQKNPSNMNGYGIEFKIIYNH